ncbi:MAG: archaeosortase/exosortase family protein [Opitutaceae bacterium]
MNELKGDAGTADDRPHVAADRGELAPSRRDDACTCGDAAQSAWCSRAAAVAAWAVAGWPVWRWYVARIRDGSDEPWGLAALVVSLVFLPWRRLRERLPLGAALLAGAVVLTVFLGYGWLPALVRGGLWMVALMVLGGTGGPALARGGLLLLSLPVVATAQFYLGFPLRALTAACSVPVLRLCGYEVVRQGTALRWAGETVLVDAPCSGIQMLWTGLFAACALAALRGLGGGATLRLLRWAGATVAGANLTRCVTLFLLEVRGGGLPAWWHSGVGLACFGAALAVVAWRAGRLPPERVGDRAGPRSPRVTADWVIPVLGLVLVGVAVRPLFGAAAAVPAELAEFPGWPERFEGRALTPLQFSEREARFAAGFPGRIGVFTDGERTILLRWVACETRQLHPALHCLRGLGYAVQPGPVWRDASGRCWGTTLARRGAQVRRVRERISDGAAREWTDVSAWWWDAWRGVSVGPWWTATVFED